MKFSEYQYTRPNIAEMTQKFDAALAAAEKATNADDQFASIMELNQMRKEFLSMDAIAYIRFTINTKDELAKKESDFFDENRPAFEGMTNKYYKMLLDSPFRKELTEKLGGNVFLVADNTLSTFSPEVLEDLKEENRLGSEYDRLIASAEIEYKGETRNLNGMIPFAQDLDRTVRKEANQKYWAFFEENQEKFDRIYDDLVKVRTKIAKKLGFNNFTELGYKRMRRLDYNPSMVANFRRQVLEGIVPLVQKIKKKQASRLELEKMAYYDDKLFFPDGNPKPKGTPEWILDNGKKMYNELSEITGKFFNKMIENEMMDVLSKPGKAAGGYNYSIPSFKSSFIFANFNGTAHDIDVLTHEAGHAFQSFMSNKWDLAENARPTMETAEIHSMSMEFFTYPYMEYFFKEDVEKYKYGHLSGSLIFLPYGVLVDEFQHFVYDNPELTAAERRAGWRELEKKYLPHIDYSENPFLESGAFWMKQGHIFQSPFYYIDYTLAQICAFQFWKRMNEDKASAWKDYVALCAMGGSDTFTKLVKKSNLISPFDDGCVESIVGAVEAHLETMDF